MAGKRMGDFDLVLVRIQKQLDSMKRSLRPGAGGIGNMVQRPDAEKRRAETPGAREKNLPSDPKHELS